VRVVREEDGEIVRIGGLRLRLDREQAGQETRRRGDGRGFARSALRLAEIHSVFILLGMRYEYMKIPA